MTEFLAVDIPEIELEGHAGEEDGGPRGAGRAGAAGRAFLNHVQKSAGRHDLPAEEVRLRDTVRLRQNVQRAGHGKREG